MNTGDSETPPEATSGQSREMTLKEYIAALPSFHVARRTFEHVLFIVHESQLSAESIRQELRNILKK